MKNLKLLFLTKIGFHHLIKFSKPTLVLRKFSNIVQFHCCKLKTVLVQNQSFSPISTRPISVSMNILISIAAANLGPCQRSMNKLFAKIVSG